MQKEYVILLKIATTADMAPRNFASSIRNNTTKTKSMKNFILLTTLLLALLTGCKKEEPTYHRDIFRCKVNGVEWVAACPSDGLFGCEPIDCQYYWKDTKGFEQIAQRTNSDRTISDAILLFKSNYLGLGQNNLQPTSGDFRRFTNISGCKMYSIDTSSSHSVNILEIDTVRFLIKGTFEFVSINSCFDTLKVTDGFFHVNFRF